MTAASSNITTHWTFRDGRDYLLSLTTTETPNTVSFWISDKITGEEWTGCYDENGIEVLTKRTGCFKSFHTFLSMIKSAILKKSDSVVIDLLNIEDLAAISLHRQNSVTDSGTIPLNLQLYSKTGEISSGSSMGTASILLNPNGKASPNPKQSDIGSGISNFNNKSSLNKRKYLIVTYIAEFDKVHYPLLLNYSNPPDLSVMQNNIITLKAEVTSLKNAKVDLENQLESFKSGCLPNSHENNNVNHNLMIRDKAINDESREPTKSRAIHSNEGDGLDAEDPCSKCLDLINALQSKVHELENVVSIERDEHLKTMDNLKNENHFLRHKVEAAEKYELELWTQMQELKEKVARASALGKGRKQEESKDIIPRNRFHQSRHDLFYYNSKTSSVASRSPQTKFSPSPTMPLRNHNVENDRRRSITNNGQNTRIYSRDRNSLAQHDTQKHSRSRSTSAASCGTVDVVTKDSDFIQKRILQQLKDMSYRSRSSSYHSIKFRKHRSMDPRIEYRNYSLSPSPSRSRFDPTAYVQEKKKKLSKIADLRVQKIESRIRSGSRPSPSEKIDQIITSSPINSSKRERSSNCLRLKNESNQRSPRAEGLRDDNEDKQNYNLPSLKDRLERKIARKAKESGDQSSRPTSATNSGATRIISHIPHKNHPETLRNTQRSPPSRLANQSDSTKYTSKRFTPEMRQRSFRSPANPKMENRTSRRMPNDVINDALPSGFIKMQKSGRNALNNDQSTQKLHKIK
ncbi:unnamed protein product [Orchesella dallaii]|uniref:Coiled-coil domain-containing protein 61 n=1 Tax=Orchesella dallaii TaxID=48710 RepID=A0ABP1PTM0_9HEXA